MENIQKIYSRKYETLGSLLADYLENILYSRDAGSEAQSEKARDFVLNVSELKDKDIKEWTLEEMEVMVHLLLTQVKPFMSVPLRSFRSRAWSTSPRSRT